MPSSTRNGQMWPSVPTIVFYPRLDTSLVRVSNVVENKKPPLQSPPCLKEGGPSQTVGGFRRGTTEGGGEKRPLSKGERATKWRGDSIWIENIILI